MDGASAGEGPRRGEALVASLKASAQEPAQYPLGDGGRTAGGKELGNEASVPTWTEEELRSFLVGLHIVNLPGEEPLLQFLSDAAQAAPLPAPWAMARDDEGCVFFVNSSAEASSWSHPLEQAIRELAGAFRVCQALGSDRRTPCVQALRNTWEQEVRYHCHRETTMGETMREHPSEVALPAHRLKIKAIDWLLDECYFSKLCACSSAPVVPAVSGPLEAGMDAIRSELEGQLRQTMEAQRALQEELSSAEHELRSEKAAHCEMRQRAFQAEAELAEERQQITDCRAECAELSRQRQQALDMASTAEQAKDALEARLATMDAGVAKSYLKRLAKQSQAAADLNASLNASIRTLDLATESTPSRIPDLTSELEPPSSLPSSRGEVGSLADVPEGTRTERAFSPRETGGFECGSGLADKEHRHFEQALAECAELSRSRDQALESAQQAVKAKAVLEARLATMEQALKERELVLAARADDLASLQAALLHEQRSRAELELVHRSEEVRCKDLEEQVEQAAESRRALQEQLCKAEEEAAQAQADASKRAAEQKDRQELLARRRSRHLEAAARRAQLRTHGEKAEGTASPSAKQRQAAERLRVARDHAAGPCVAALVVEPREEAEGEADGQRPLPSEGRKHAQRSAAPSGKRHARGRAAGAEGELGGTRYHSGKVSAALVEEARRAKASDAAACLEGLAHCDKETIHTRQALEDAIVLASRIQLLRAEGQRTRRRLHTALERKRAIVAASHCIQQLASPATSRPATVPADVERAVGASLETSAEDADLVAGLPPATQGEDEEECAAEDADSQLAALVLQSRLAATKESLLQSNAFLKVSLALSSASLAAETPCGARPAAERTAAAPGPATEEPAAADPHEAAVVSALRYRLAAAKAQMGRLNAALRAEVEELRRCQASPKLLHSALAEEPTAARA